MHPCFVQRENAIYKEVAGLSFSVVNAPKGYKTSLPVNKLRTDSTPESSLTAHIAHFIIEK